LGSGEARGGSRTATARAPGSFIRHTLPRFARIETPSGQFQEQIGEQRSVELAQ